jgi:hypothetical protein
MADRPPSPSKQEEVKIEVEEPKVHTPLELVLPMAAHTYTREQCMDMVHSAIIATKKGMSIRFA